MRVTLALTLVALTALAADPQQDAQQKAFLSQWCAKCHAKKAYDTPEAWTRAVMRVRNMEMPPRTAPQPPLDARESFVSSVDASLKAQACAAGLRPGPARTRRLNRDEYSATVRDLLNVNLEVGATLPVDGAGGEGFDNAAETLTISPILAEKYLEAARTALEFASTDSRAKAAIFIARPGPNLTEAAAAQRILEAFLPRAYRRPVPANAAAPYLDLFKAARQHGEPFERAVLYSLRGVLMSPQFLFRIETPSAELKRVDDFTLASRLSYFLWGSQPDELLWDLAASGRLHEPEILRGQIGRMLRNLRSTDFSRRFVEQWLRTRELGRDRAPDPQLFPVWAESEEIRSDLRYQPVLFFRELLVHDLSLLNLIDSKFTIFNRNLAKLYKLDVKWRADAARALYRVELPARSDRGGLLGMPGILTLTSYPNRTSPVLRGAWVLDTLLGTPPPPPPPGVPPLEAATAAHPATMRERLTQHRANPVCASCHTRMDPIGFALENYDAMGFWRTDESGKPIDAQGEFMDGRRFNGPVELKAALMDRKDLFLRNLARKMLGYALGRSLTLQDECVVDGLLSELKSKDYRAQALIEAVVFSVPFQHHGESATRPGQK